MIAPSEETLMSYADGELGASASEALALHLRRDGEAAAIVLMYRQTAILLELAFERPMWEPAVDRLPAAAPAGWRQRLWRLEFLVPAQSSRRHRDPRRVCGDGSESHETAN